MCNIINMNHAEAEQMFLDLLLEDSRPVVLNVESSSSSSDSDFEIDSPKRRKYIDNYVETIIPNYSEEEFKFHFRMKRCTTQMIMELFSTIVGRNPGGWPKVSVEKICYMTIWYLSNQETFRQIGDRFDVPKGTAHKIIRKAVAWLRRLAPHYIKWPSEDEMKIITSQFKNKEDLQNVIGVIDVSHIPIKKPHDNGEDYINRKGFPSILLQGVSDANLKFINISAGEPGSLHDARMLRRSVLYKKAIDDEEAIFKGNILLGNSAYPSLHWLIPPYKDNGLLTNEQKQFNLKHSSTRIVVKNAFGLLKGRFRRLKHFENNDIKFIVDCIIAACVLHNICQIKNDEGETFIDDDSEEDEEDSNTNVNTLGGRDTNFELKVHCI